jgi:DNA-binding CsgD family transcriptional regulator
MLDPIMTDGAAPARVDDLAQLALEALDLPVFLVTTDLSRVVLSNSSADAVLRSWGAPRGKLPVSLVRALAWPASPSANSIGFTAPDGNRWRVRKKAVGFAHLLVTVSANVLRESELKELLAPFVLTRQQIRLVALVCRGLANQDIAHELDISVGTLKNYLTAIYLALEVDGRNQLMVRVQTLANQRE